MYKAVKGAPIFCHDSPLIKSDNREEKKRVDCEYAIGTS